MGNLFETTNYPEQEPERVHAGDLVAWKRTDLGIDHPPASYALRYVGRGYSDSQAEIAIDATADGSDFLVEVDNVITDLWVPDRYAMVTTLTRNSDSRRLTIARWTLEVLPDRDSDDADPREWAHRALTACRAVIEQTATKEQQAMSVEGVSFARRSPGELMLLERRLARAVSRIEATKRRQAGKGAGTRVRAIMP